MATVRLQIGRKVREEQDGYYVKYDSFSRLSNKSKLSKVSFSNMEELARLFNITWEKGIVYKVYQTYKGQKDRYGTGFAFLGQDNKGNAFMYDRRETGSKGAGQTRLHTEKDSIQVSEILKGRKTFQVINGKFVSDLDENKKPSKKRTLKEYFAESGENFGDVPGINFIEDFDPTNNPIYDRVDENWLKDKRVVAVFNKYKKVYEKLSGVIDSLSSYELDEEDAEVIDDSIYDGSDAYDSVDDYCEYLPKFYDKQIKIILALSKKAKSLNEAKKSASTQKRKIVETIIKILKEKGYLK